MLLETVGIITQSAYLLGKNDFIVLNYLSLLVSWNFFNILTHTPIFFSFVIFWLMFCEFSYWGVLLFLPIYESYLYKMAINILYIINVTNNFLTQYLSFMILHV